MIYESEKLVVEEGDENDTVLIDFCDTPLSLKLTVDDCRELYSALEEVALFFSER